MHKVIRAMLYIAIPLLILRLLAPQLILSYVNGLLDKQNGVAGSVEDIDIFVFNGSYTVKGIELYHRVNDEKRPLLNANSLRFSLDWAALLRGEVVTAMQINQPGLFIKDKVNEAESIDEAVLNETTWLGLARNLTPVSIETLDVVDGSIQFVAKDSETSTEFSITNINGSVTNLHNNADSSLLTEVNFESAVNGTATLTVNGSLNPNSAEPIFDINVDMTPLPLSETRQIIDLYAPFDIDAGQFDMAAEIKADHGQVDGYIKFGVYELSVFSFKDDVIKGWSDKDDSLIQPFVEAFSGLIAQFLENDKQSLIATRVPLEGDIANPDIPYFIAFSGFLKNAFIEAYKLKVENIVSFSGKDQDRE